MRLDKFICKSTLLNRLQAQTLIREGQVMVNQKVIKEANAQVHANNCVTMNKQILIARPPRYLMIHKPANTVCSNVDEVYPSVFSAVGLSSEENHRQYDVALMHIAGRLDADTTGLVLATDDGHWSFNITRPDQHCQKVYRVNLRNQISQQSISAIQQGIKLQGEDKLTRPAIIQLLSPKQVLLTITEGKFHQVKRMFAAIGNKVEALHRQQIGKVKLDIPPGVWRELSQQEIDGFTESNTL
ncbi:pseudouridine synthase [Agarivorans sp. MS3-6]